MLVESPTGLKTAAGRGNLTSTSDYDYWMFQGTAGSIVSVGIDIPGNPAASGLYIRLDKPDGTQAFAFNSDYSGFGQSQSYTLPVDGNYTVLVRYNYDYQGEYNLKVLMATPPVQIELEGNNSVANATPVVLSTNGNSRTATVAGYVYNNVELDYLAWAL